MFRLEGQARRLPGGSRPAFRVGDVVVKRLHARSLETEHSLELAPWLAGELARVEEQGFRIARPVAAQDGRWMLADGWAAWTFVEGRPAEPQDVPEVIAALQALHGRLRQVEKHPLLDENTTAWGLAHHRCWERSMEGLHPRLGGLVEALYARYERLPPLECQLIHGDLNAENVLLAPGRAPGVVDFTPFWAPADFAVAMFANWIGPRKADMSVLPYFENVPHFDQLLLRAAVRMLWVVSELEGVQHWETAPEKRAAELVLELSQR